MRKGDKNMAKSTKKPRTTKQAGSTKKAASRQAARRAPAARSNRKTAVKRAARPVGQYAQVNGLRMYYEVHGSGELVQTLLKHDLIDAFRLWTFPVLLGPGKRLFENGTLPARLKLVETRTSSTGAVLHVLESAGAPAYGSFALEHPTEAEMERRRKIEAPLGR